MTTENQKQIVADALLKSNSLVNDNTQIRLYGATHEKSYWVYRFHGKLFIGCQAGESLEPVFPNKTVYEMRNRDGKVISEVQFLKHA